MRGGRTRSPQSSSLLPSPVLHRPHIDSNHHISSFSLPCRALTRSSSSPWPVRLLLPLACPAPPWPRLGSPLSFRIKYPFLLEINASFTPVAGEEAR